MANTVFHFVLPFQGNGEMSLPTQGDAPRLTPLCFALGWNVVPCQGGK
jgi:hypothetical protein